MMAGERTRISNHPKVRSDSVQLSPQEQRGHELHRQELRIARTQPSAPDELTHQFLPPSLAAAHPLEQVDAAVLSEPKPMGHEDAKEPLLARR